MWRSNWVSSLQHCHADSVRAATRRLTAAPSPARKTRSKLGEPRVEKFSAMSDDELEREEILKAEEGLEQLLEAVRRIKEEKGIK